MRRFFNKYEIATINLEKNLIWCYHFLEVEFNTPLV